MKISINSVHFGKERLITYTPTYVCIGICTLIHVCVSVLVDLYTNFIERLFFTCIKCENHRLNVWWMREFLCTHTYMYTYIYETYTKETCCNAFDCRRYDDENYVNCVVFCMTQRRRQHILVRHRVIKYISILQKKRHSFGKNDIILARNWKKKSPHNNINRGEYGEYKHWIIIIFFNIQVCCRLVQAVDLSSSCYRPPVVYYIYFFLLK